MRLNERRAGFLAQPAWLAECWTWIWWLLASRGLARSTMAAYAASLGAFADWVAKREDLDYTDLPVTVIDEWQRDMWYHRKASAGRRAYSLNALRSFYDWRSTRGLGRNVVAGVKPPKISKRAPRKYTTQQLQQLFKASRKAITSLVSKRDEVMLAVLYATGMRREEIATLRLDQIELDERIAVFRIHGKGAKEREVATEGPVVKLLREWLALRGELDGVMTDCVFFTARRNWWGQAMGPKTVERMVCAVAKRAGLGEWGVHRFRVTFATQLYDDGIDLERIRVLLGHENIETTRKYLAVSNKQRKYRLKAFRQHEVLGTRPEGLPRWARAMGDRAI
jgi:site-specific recombinase XerD